MQDGFHARKSALTRRYRYDIGTDDAAASPFRRPFEWALVPAPGAAALRAAATLLHGEHDFRAFAARGQAKPHYRCRLAVAEWTERREGRGVSFHVEADRFLHHMVRMLVGTMVDIGLGRRPVSDIDDAARAGRQSAHEPAGAAAGPLFRARPRIRPISALPGGRGRACAPNARRSSRDAMVRDA